MGKSMSDIFGKTYALAVAVCDMAKKTGADNEVIDRAYAYADGLVWDRLERTMYGRCSLQAFLEFDIAQEEEKLKKDIKAFKAFLKEDKESSPEQKEGKKKTLLDAGQEGYMKKEKKITYEDQEYDGEVLAKWLGYENSTHMSYGDKYYKLRGGHGRKHQKIPITDREKRRK
jgi:hypothetical protein